MTAPTISTIVTVYNGEQYITETLTAILSQTRVPDEIIVVDDGSTDGTSDELRKFRGDVRLIRKVNGGHASALNRGFAEARGDYLAKCDADDVWRLDKLERQSDALLAHPQIDVAFSAAWIFGLVEMPYGLPGADREPGILNAQSFARLLYRENVICPSSSLVRRHLYSRLGPFVDDLPAEDYDYWMRALAAGAVFYYDPEYLVRYRRHSKQITSDVLRVRRAAYTVRLWHTNLIEDRRLVRSVLAQDLREIGRMLVDQESPGKARGAFRASLRRQVRPTTLAWSVLLSAPEPCRRWLIDASIAAKRAITGGAGATAV